MTDPRRAAWASRTARHRHREFWEAAHAEGWEAGAPTSRLATWSSEWIPADGRGLRCLELGYGTAPDLPVFLDRGYTVAGIELSQVAASHGRARSREMARPEGVPRPILDVGDALEFLATQPDGSATVVYANLFHSMAVPPQEERKRWEETFRVLAPGGWHVYSVRTHEDRWFGVGRRLGPSTFDPGEDGPPLRFFTEAELARRIRGRFRPIARANGSEGSGRFERRVLYAVDQKYELPPPSAGGSRKG